MNSKQHIRSITVTGMLIALGITIPMFMPKFNPAPAISYTLASHVPIFIAMFISPKTAIGVGIGTAFGFLISTNPLIAARALSHLIFAVFGSLYLQKNSLVSKANSSLLERHKLTLFNLVIALVHAVGEFSIIVLLTFKSLTPEILLSNFLFLGVGTVIHSYIDFLIAYPITKVIKN